MAADLTWVTDEIAVGGGIWDEAGMIAVAREGVTHILNMQAEFDDTRLANLYLVDALWNPTEDDYEPKPPALLRKGVEYALKALGGGSAKLLIHCAAGVHRAPMMTLAVMCAQGWDVDEAMETIERLRPEAEFVDVYVESVRGFLREYATTD